MRSRRITARPDDSIQPRVLVVTFENGQVSNPGTAMAYTQTYVYYSPQAITKRIKINRMAGCITRVYRLDPVDELNPGKLEAVLLWQGLCKNFPGMTIRNEVKDG